MLPARRLKVRFSKRWAMPEPSLTALLPANRSIALVGAGKMGGGLLTAWLRGGLQPQDIIIIDPFLSSDIKSLGVLSNPSDDEVKARNPYCLVAAVKPQMAASILPEIITKIPDDCMILSLMAGVNIARLQDFAGGRACVRTMPNTPAAIGYGMTALYASPSTRDDQKHYAQALMMAAGETVWLNDEALMDAVTALSGSGPAYIYYLAETMAAAAQAQGLEPDIAMRLACQTILGAGMMLTTQEESARALRENVTSPGGTTEAALQVLMAEAGLRDIMSKAIEAAVLRGKELSNL